MDTYFQYKTYKYIAKYNALKTQKGGNIINTIITLLTSETHDKQKIDDLIELLNTNIKYTTEHNIPNKYINFDFDIDIDIDIFEPIHNKKTILHYLILTICHLFNTKNNFGQLTQYLYNSILFTLTKINIITVRDYIDEDNKTIFNYLENTVLKTFGSNGKFALYYLFLFNTFAPKYYKFNHSDSIRMELMITCILSCYTLPEDEICKLLSKIEPQLDNHIKYDSLIAYASKYNNKKIMNILKTVIVTPGEINISNYFTVGDDALKYVVSYHGKTANNLFVVPKGVTLFFMAPSGMFGYSFILKQNNQKKCTQPLSIIKNYTAIENVLDNYNSLHQLHVYDQYSIVPNLVLTIKQSDDIARGVITFNNANKPFNDLYETETETTENPTLLINKFHDTYFENPAFLSDVVMKAGELHKITTKNVILVITACRVCTHTIITDAITNCNIEGHDIFFNTSIQHFNNPEYWNMPNVVDDIHLSDRFKKIVSGSMYTRNETQNFVSDINNMLSKINVPKVEHRITEFFNSAVNGIPFSFKKLCEIYKLGYLFSFGYNGDKSMDLAVLHQFIPYDIYKKYLE